MSPFSPAADAVGAATQDAPAAARAVRTTVAPARTRKVRGSVRVGMRAPPIQTIFIQIALSAGLSFMRADGRAHRRPARRQISLVRRNPGRSGRFPASGPGPFGPPRRPQRHPRRQQQQRPEHHERRAPRPRPRRPGPAAAGAATWPSRLPVSRSARAVERAAVGGGLDDRASWTAAVRRRGRSRAPRASRPAPTPAPAARCPAHSTAASRQVVGEQRVRPEQPQHRRQHQPAGDGGRRRAG